MSKEFKDLIKIVAFISVWTLTGATSIGYLRYTHSSTPIYRSDIAAYLFLGLLMGPTPLVAIAVEKLVPEDTCVFKCGQKVIKPTCYATLDSGETVVASYCGRLVGDIWTVQVDEEDPKTHYLEEDRLQWR